MRRITGGVGRGKSSKPDFKESVRHDLIHKAIGEQTLAQLRVRFAQYDTDSSGQINTTELAELLRACGMNPTNEDIDMFLQMFDTNDDGTLSFQEFVVLWSMRLAVQDTEADEKALYQRAFAFFDRDDDGFIERDEFRRVISEIGEPLSEEEVTTFMQAVDINEDGAIEFNELLGFLWTENRLCTRDIHPNRALISSALQEAMTDRNISARLDGAISLREERERKMKMGSLTSVAKEALEQEKAHPGLVSGYNDPCLPCPCFARRQVLPVSDAPGEGLPFWQRNQQGTTSAPEAQEMSIAARIKQKAAVARANSNSAAATTPAPASTSTPPDKTQAPPPLDAGRQLSQRAGSSTELPPLGAPPLGGASLGESPMRLPPNTLPPLKSTSLRPLEPLGPSAPVPALPRADEDKPATEEAAPPPPGATGGEEAPAEITAAQDGGVPEGEEGTPAEEPAPAGEPAPVDSAGAPEEGAGGE